MASLALRKDRIEPSQTSASCLVICLEHDVLQLAIRHVEARLCSGRS